MSDSEEELPSPRPLVDGAGLGENAQDLEPVGTEADASAQGPSAVRRKRKRRAHLNCSECRRLKLKCDRKVPCDNCVKRACQELCPDRSRSPVRGPPSVRRPSHGKGVESSPNANTPHTKQERPRPALTSSASGDPDVSGQGPARAPSPNGSFSHGFQMPYTIPTPPHASHPRPQQQQPGPQADGHFPSRSWTDGNRQIDPPLYGGVRMPNVMAEGSPHLSSGSNAPAIPRPPSVSAQSGGFNLPYLPASRLSPLDNARHFPHAVASGGTVYPSSVPGSSTAPAAAGEMSNLSPSEQSHGTLVISHTGRSKYLGPSAASEWLKDQEVLESANRTPAVSRASSPPSHLHQADVQSHFPFSRRTQTSRSGSIAALLAALPSRDEAEALIDSYHRYFGWSYDIVPKSSMATIMNETYSAQALAAETSTRVRISRQKVALLYIVLAMGALHNLELAPDDPVSEEYLARAKDALASDDFMTNNTIAGVQTLVVMAHYHLETDKGRDGDSAWPLWGLAMRIIQAMGIHRDGERWHLPADVVEERRRLFWETHSAEIFQANCFSRPCSIPAEFMDTKLPNDLAPSYHTLRAELSKISKDVLYCALTVQPPPFESFINLYERLVAFEKAVPYPLRCRTALMALPSRYSDPRMAEADSPESSKRDLRRTFEQHSLSLMIAEAIVNLYRPYFMRALTEFPQDPFRSQFGQPFLLVVERSNVIIQIVCNLYSMHPSVTSRNWWCWYHAFNSAVCLGTLILMSPQIDLAPVALGSIEQVIAIYTNAVQNRSSPRFAQNLRWLLRLRQRAVDRINNSRGHADTSRNGGTSSSMSFPSGQEQITTGEGLGEEISETDAALLGWRTRFIERATRDSQRATTIFNPLPLQLLSAAHDLGTAEGLEAGAGAAAGLGALGGDIEGVLRSIPQAVQEHVAMASGSEGLSTDMSNMGNVSEFGASSTDMLLHQFWDPLMNLQDTDPTSTAALNWWDILTQPPES